MPKKTKLQIIRELLSDNGGATIQSISEEIGWQLHSVRAAISGLRKQGLAVERSGKGAGAVYRIAASDTKK